MNLTPEESKSMERLRKSGRQWRWRRWLLLGLSVLCAANCIGFSYLLRGLIAESHAGSFDGEIVFFIVLLWTKCCVHFFLAVWFLKIVCTKWHGDVNQMLLLRLVDEKES
jgi:hypothetical protein